MKNIRSKKAYTLIELIVSLMLVAFIALGIFAISTVLNNNNVDYGQRYLVKSQTQAALNHILNNAALAIGSANANDEAILIGAAVGDANSFCIHQGPNNNIINSASNIWLCYSLSSNQINWCAVTYSPGADPRGASSCSAAVIATTVIPFSGNNTTFLGSAYSFTNPAPVFNATNGFTITIQDCLNNTSATCSNTGVSTDPVNNPETQVTGSVIPPQVGTG